MPVAALEFGRELCTIQSRCNGAIAEHKFSYCQGEDVAGGMEGRQTMDALQERDL